MRRVVSIWLKRWPIERLMRAETQATGSRQTSSASRPEAFIGSAPARTPTRPPNDTPVRWSGGGAGRRCSQKETAPFALVEKADNALRLVALNGPAEYRGLVPGMALADAKAMVPGLVTDTAAPAADAKALLGLAHWASRYTPWVTVAEPDGLFLDITGAAHLFATRDMGGEEGLLRDLAARLKAAGLTARLGLADTPGAAHAIAVAHTRRTVDAVIVPPGTGADALRALPVAALRLAPETVLTLNRFGLKAIGQLYGIPRAALARRFDSDAAADAVLLRLDQALGHAGEPIDPLAQAPAYRARLAFAEPIAELDAIEATLAALTRDLMPALAEAEEGARRLSLHAYRVDGTVRTATVALAEPGRAVGHILRLFADKLPAIDPGFGIDLLLLAADHVERLPPDQTSLTARLDGAGTDPVRLGQLVDRLANRFGPARITELEERASHIPERAQCAVPAGRGRVNGHKRARAEPVNGHTPRKPPRPPQLFERPEPITVLAEIPEGPPASFTWRRVRRQVIKAEGPERIAPEWWTGDGALGACDGCDGASGLRDYYRLEDAGGRRYWVYRDGLFGEPQAPRWYVHGLFP
ncbi:MAG: DNA polymerase Y family protein [Sphingomonadales bacterium]|nr:DNA polymerase Y family protein [Sphingomonadales bacterium]